MPIKLNIGAGDTDIEGFTPIDRKNGQEAFPLDYEDGSVEEIRASHILEHFGWEDAQKALAEWARVLKPGGRIRIAVPDFDKIDKSDPLWAHYVMGGQTDSDDFHRSLFDTKTLTRHMTQAGFGEIAPWASDNTDTAAHPVSLNLEGVKAEKEPGIIKMVALMSLPRVGWNDAWGQVFDALAPFKIPIRRFSGVYWGQCMQRALETCVEDGLDWALCIDYDSMFTKEHLNTLMGEFGSNPDIDAIAAMQSRRAKQYPLMTVAGQTSCSITLSPIKVTTAHFGLTLIRIDALKDVPKPWFVSQPDDKGEWSDDRMDDDIWFWHQWRKAGKTIYVSPNARIGHLELMVSDFDWNLKHRLSTVCEWRDREGVGDKRKGAATSGDSDANAVTEMKNANETMGTPDV